MRLFDFHLISQQKKAEPLTQMIISSGRLFTLAHQNTAHGSMHNVRKGRNQFYDGSQNRVIR